MKLLLAMLFAIPLNASANCLLMADMALVARALAEDGIGEVQARRVMVSVYGATGVPGEVIDRFVTAAANVSQPALAYARYVKAACESVKRGGVDAQSSQQ